MTIDTATADAPCDATAAAATHGEGKPPFRTDIEGLRAVALALVLLYHAEVPGLSGGFVGVDVFFVISGFLITGNLVRERASTGGISLLDFWLRRLRRLAPALAVMSVATVAGAWLVLSPLEWRAVVRDGIWSSAYLSNVEFARQAQDYFADGSQSLFLHTWSLSVEEQFYVAWPLLIALLLGIAARVGGLGRRLLPAVLLSIGGVSSFALGVLLTERGTPWAFFGLPTRAWQFVAGGLLVLVPIRLPNRTTAAVVGLVGVALLAWASTTFDGLTDYPGVAALAPTLATVLVLVAGSGDGSAIGRALSVGPVRAVGRLSYSWYLWHWPVMRIAVAAADRDYLFVRSTAVLASGLPAWLSLRSVEQPVRSSSRLGASRGLTVAAVGGFVVVSLASIAALEAWSRHELARPLYSGLARAEADGDYHRACRTDDRFPGTCVLGPADGPTIVVLGDSHAGAMIPAYALAAEQIDARILVRTRGGCPSPAVPIARAGTRDESAACNGFRRASGDLIDAVDPDLVVLNNAAFLGRILTGPSSVGSTADQANTWRSGVGAQIAALQTDGHRVGLVLNGPQLPFDPITCIGREGSADACEVSRSEAMETSDRLRAVEIALSDEAGLVTPFDVADALCDAERCHLRVGDTYTLLDPDHFTATFSASLAPDLAAFLAMSLAAQEP